MIRDKKGKNDFVDDGSVIANMNIDGIPGSLIRRKPSAGFAPKSEETAGFSISKDERRAIMQGVSVSYILSGAIFFGLLALFILFCTSVWFK